MIDLRGVQRTIEDIRRHGGSMEDLHDLAMLYALEERMQRGESGQTATEAGRLTRADAEAWVAALQNEDPAKPKGGKWTIEQLKPLAQKRGIPTDGEKLAEFWAVTNALYSDYCAVAKKHNVLSSEFFADMAAAWLEDRDAVENKAAVYYERIVK